MFASTYEFQRLLLGQTPSVVLVPGIEIEFFTVQNVPHGSVHRHFYHNPDIKALRTVHVYTPPGYEEYQDKTWPVLFLFQGSGGTDESWFRVGKANVILDNLISKRLAKPMIVVAPFGHTVEPGTHGWPFVQEQGNFVQDFTEVLMPSLPRVEQSNRHVESLKSAMPHITTGESSTGR